MVPMGTSMKTTIAVLYYGPVVICGFYCRFYSLSAGENKLGGENISFAHKYL
jgi:hypothetical protein